MVDLHIHSVCSDGSDTYIEILKKAESMGTIVKFMKK